MSRAYKYNTGANNTAQTAPRNDSGSNVAWNYYEVTLGAAVNSGVTADIYIPTTPGTQIYGVVAVSAPNATLSVNANKIRLTATANIAAGAVISFGVFEGA